MLMSETHYLPNEELKVSNYPEIARVEDGIDQIMELSSEVNTAVADYTNGDADYVYINIELIRDGIQLCRDVLGVLGNADKPCFDVMMDLRNIQTSFHDVLYTYNRHGEAYVQDPTSTTTAGGNV